MGEIDEDYYYKPIKTMSAFNGNYIEYESKGDKDKNLSVKKCLYKIIPYLRSYHFPFGEWKIQFTIQVNFISSKDSKEIRTMYTKNCNAAIMIGSEKDDIITELIDSLLQNYQINLEESTRGSELIFDSIDNFQCEKKVTLLMITDGEKWHYLAVKKGLPALLRGITSNHNVDFYSLNCFHSYSTENRLKRHERVCNDHDYCHVEMPNEDNKILKYNHGEKSLKVSAIINVDIENLLPKMHSCENNPG